MVSTTQDNTKNPTSRGCSRMLFRPCSKSHQPDTAPKRIPLTESDKRAQRKLQLACLFSLLFMCAEVVGGFLAGSLAIMTDAAHLLSDVAGFCISLFAIWLNTRPATGRLSFGFQRAEVIGAVTSVLVIWVLTGVLISEAIGRFVECLEPHPEEHVNGQLMFIVAVIGLLVNLILMKILGHGHSHGGSHGHSHGGGHGHSHNSGGHGHSHGHSHGEVGSHGHAHGGCETGPRAALLDSPLGDERNNEEEVHGHSHGHNHSHEHSHEHESPAHGHYHAHSENHGQAVSGDLEAGPEMTPKKKLENLNIRSAYIHALGDFIQSIGVCIAGGLIWWKPEWQIADPIATFMFSVLVLFTTVGIIRDSIHILMEGTPAGIHTEEIESGLRACESVVDVHDLHVWSLNAGLPSLSVHLVTNDVETALQAAQRYLISVGVIHATIQTEKASTLYPRDCNAGLKCGQVSNNANRV